jgi:glycosyltransferase involved in cell wall biosynthesis
MAVSGGAEATFKQILELFPGAVYTSQCRRESFPWLEGHEVHTSLVQHLPMALDKHYVYAPVMPLIYRRFDLREADVVLVDSHSFAHHCRVRQDALCVCYYHTTARSLWTPEVDDRARAGRLGWARRLLAPTMKRLDLLASRNPHFVIANSRTTADRIRRFYHREPDRVIYPPVDTLRWADVHRSSCEEGLIYWGRLVSYKRIDIAIEAARQTGERLNIVGAGPMEPALKQLARGLPNVRIHGRLSDDELKRLMSHCWGAVFPCYEDFGLVPVEAMASGLPVVAFGKGGATETVGQLGGVLFDEQTPSSMAAAISRLKRLEFDETELRKRASEFDVAIFRTKFSEAVELAIASMTRQ